MKPEEPSMRCLFGSLRTCISHDTFFSRWSPQCWALPAQRTGSLSCWGNAQLQLCSLLAFLLLVCFTWSLSLLHVLPLQSCPYRPAPVVWERWLSVSCMSLQYKSCGKLGSLNVFSSFPYLQLGYVLRKRADLGVCHFPWIKSKENTFPCSPCHSHRLLLQFQWGLSSFKCCSRHHSIYFYPGAFGYFGTPGDLVPWSL